MFEHLIPFIQHYGYLAIAIASLFEGETVLFLGGLAVHQGYLLLPIVFVASLVGTFVGDNIFFFLGRYKGEQLVRRYTFFKKLNKVSGKISGKSGVFLSFAMRFMYGFRHLLPFSLGMSAIKTRTFMLFNFLGGVCWVISLGLAGYFFGSVFETVIGHIKRYEFRAIVVTVLVIVFGNMIYKAVRSMIENRWKKTEIGEIDKIEMGE